MNTGREIGKEWERTLQSVFSSLRKQYGFSWHSFVDTHTAGGMVQAQPSDYLIMVEGSVMFLEAKSSTRNKKLQPSMLRPKQRQTILHESRLLRLPYWVLFGQTTEGYFQLFRGIDVVEEGFSRSYPIQLEGEIKELESKLREFFNLRKLSEIVNETL